MKFDPYAIILSSFIIAVGISIVAGFIGSSGDTAQETVIEEVDMNPIEKLIFQYPTATFLIFLVCILFMFRLYMVL